MLGRLVKKIARLETWQKVMLAVLVVLGISGAHFVFDHVQLNQADALVEYPPAALLQPGDITGTMVRDGTLTNADISDTAGITLGKLAGSNNGWMVADSGGLLEEVSPSTMATLLTSNARSGANSDITSLSGLTTPLTSTQGGSGADLHTCAQGGIPYFSATGTMSCLTAGTSGNLLQTKGASANPQWANFSVNVQSSSTLRTTVSNSYNTSSATYTKLKWVTTTFGGSMKVGYTYWANTVGDAAFCKTYDNGVAVGTEQSDSTGSLITYSETINNINPGDQIQVYCHGDGTHLAYVKDLTLSYDFDTPGQ